MSPLRRISAILRLITSFISGKNCAREGVMFDANDPNPTEPFYLIVTDIDRGVFCVEGPMTDDRPWEAAARFAREQPAPHRVRPDRRGS